MLYIIIKIQWIKFIILFWKAPLQFVQYLTNFTWYFNRNYFVFYAKLTTPCFSHFLLYPTVVELSSAAEHGGQKNTYHTAIEVTKCNLGHMTFDSSSRDLVTLKSWTPITANMNSRRNVTSTMLPMVLTATITHWTTCWNEEKNTYALHNTTATTVEREKRTQDGSCTHRGR